MTSKGADKSDKKSDRYKFQEGEQVLCYHGPLIYEAKCIKTKAEYNQVNYLIHYNGWNKSWDEWVEEERLLKHNEENLLKKTELDRNQKALKKSNKRRTSVGSGGDKDDNNSRSNSPKPPLFGRKSVFTPTSQITQLKVEKSGNDSTPARKTKNVILPINVKSNLRDSEVTGSITTIMTKQEYKVTESKLTKVMKLSDDCALFGSLVVSKLLAMDEQLRETPPISYFSEISQVLAGQEDRDRASELEYRDNITIHVHIPEEIQNVLLYDLELVCKRKKVTKLPARVPVSEITENYVLHKTSVTEQSSKFKEIALALREYFDTVLPTKLLYPLEKQQYQKYMEGKTVSPSSVYSVIHLIRMLVKIGSLLAHLALDNYGTNLIEENINDYIRYLNLNINKFISIEDYQSTPSRK